MQCPLSSPTKLIGIPIESRRLILDRKIGSRRALVLIADEVGDLLVLQMTTGISIENHYVFVNASYSIIPWPVPRPTRYPGDPDPCIVEHSQRLGVEEDALAWKIVESR